MKLPSPKDVARALPVVVELGRGLWDALTKRKPSKRVDALTFTDEEIERARVRRFYRDRKDDKP